jgi:hypothetical protein
MLCVVEKSPVFLVVVDMEDVMSFVVIVMEVAILLAGIRLNMKVLCLEKNYNLIKGNPLGLF